MTTNEVTVPREVSVAEALDRAKKLMAKVHALSKAYTLRGLTKEEREQIKLLLDPAKAELDALLSSKVS